MLRVCSNFFYKQKTAYEMRISDWSSDVCSSDLSILSARVVDGLSEAMSHINTHGSHHTDAIVTENAEKAEAFLNGVDSAIVMWNASSQFADGGDRKSTRLNSSH